MSISFQPSLCGWTRDLPDPRDYTPSHERVQALLGTLPTRPVRSRSIPVDWQEYCPPVWDSPGVPAGTAMACASLVAYYDRRARGRGFIPSWWFLHRMARVLGHQTGNTSTPFRLTLKALVRFGLPPLEYEPFDPARLDETPAAFLFSFAREYAELLFLRLDEPALRPEHLLTTVKGFLAGGFALGFGVSLFDTLGHGPDVPFPSAYDQARGGAALVAVGLDDGFRVGCERGALRVRSPWGTEWGEGGYGWLPYRYVTEGLAGDFWTILRSDWLGEGEFTNPC